MSNQKGFTLIELMIVVAIVAILAGIALPEYQKYVVKARQAEYITVADSYKVPFAICYSETSKVADCADYDLMPAAITASGGGSTEVKTLSMDASGKITVETNDAGVKYTLTPNIAGGKITWTAKTVCSGTEKDLCFGENEYVHVE